VDEAFVRRQLKLTMHPPRAVEEMLAGNGPIESIMAVVKSAPEEIWPDPLL
jgi:hypothetical protein